MEKHIEFLLNRISLILFTLATLILMFLFLHTPQTCISPTLNTHLKPHQKFPKSTCDHRPRDFLPPDKKNKRLWSSSDWNKKVQSFTSFFTDLGFITNHSRVLCVSAGAGHEVMALREMGVKDVTGVEVVDVLPLVSRADVHNLPYFDEVFDVVFSAHFDEALYPDRYVREMERVVRKGGECVLVVELCGEEEVKGIVKLFGKSRFVGAADVSLIGLRMTRIVMEVRGSES